MTEIRFYHLQRARLEDVLPVILERCHQRGDRALVLAGSEERVEALAAHLWTYRPESFLPHGSLRDGNPADQPIFLATAPDASLPPGDAGGNPNQAPVLVLTDGARHGGIAGFRLVCEFFDGHDETAVAQAREQWRSYRAAGHAVVYFQQSDSGKWQETARA